MTQYHEPSLKVHGLSLSLCKSKHPHLTKGHISRFTGFQGTATYFPIPPLIYTHLSTTSRPALAVVVLFYVQLVRAQTDTISCWYRHYVCMYGTLYAVCWSCHCHQ
jgi:hypothetical protein